MSSLHQSSKNDQPARAQFVGSAVRSALLEIAWSHISLENPVRAIISPDSAAAYSTKGGQAAITIGCGLRPAWPAADAQSSAERFALEYGPDFDFSPASEGRFIAQQALRQYGHCLYSDASMPQIARAAQDLGADPVIFGLLETMRVDCLIAIALGRSMSWENFYPRSDIDGLEQSLQPLARWVRSGAMMPAGGAEAFEKTCARFYSRVISAPSSRDVAFLAIEWKSVIAPMLGLAEAEPKRDQEPGIAGPAPQDGIAGNSLGISGEQEDLGSAQPSIGGDSGGEAPPPRALGDGVQDESAHPAAAPAPSLAGSQAKDPSTEASETPSSPGTQPADPARRQESPKSGMLEQIAAGREQQEPSHAWEESGSMDSDREISSPSSQEIQAQRDAQKAGHGFSSGAAPEMEDADDDSWQPDLANPQILAGSSDFFSKLFFDSHAPVDQQQAGAARKILERMLTGQTRTTFSHAPSKRLSIRHLVQGEPKYARREDFSRGAMRIDLIVDCSSSMSGAPMASAKALVSALSELSAKGLVEGRALFSSGSGWMACPLPMRPELVAKMAAFSGSEGIRAAVDANIRHLREADAVFVFTDAHITDRPFSKEHLSKSKVEPMGLYVGSAQAQENMARHFERYLIRPSLEELCLAMVQRFLTQKKMVATRQLAKAKMRR